MLRISKNLILSSFCLLPALSFAVKAEPVTQQHIVVAPQCLIKNLNADYKKLATTNKLVLIETNDSGIDQLIEAKHQQKEICGGFLDVTTEWKALNLKTASPSMTKSFLLNYETPRKSKLAIENQSYDIKYEEQVKDLLKKLNPSNMWSDLTTLTNFTNRSASSAYGVEAANWIKTQIETMAQTANRRDVTVYFVQTCDMDPKDKCTDTLYDQPSVVAKIGDSSEPGIVIGSHMDTTANGSRQPGADDDGSGSATVLETARTLIASKLHFKKPIYLIWYAAEEKGLVGSKFVVADFKKKNIPISAVMQFDLTGYAHNNEPTMWLMTDYVNQNLTAYLETLIKTYVNKPVNYSQCGYACSDHATWHRNGFAASLPAEAAYKNTNRYIHSVNDTMDKLSLTHMTDYAKLSIAFAVELAEPVNS